MIGTLIAAVVPAAIDVFRKVVDAATTKWIGYTVDDQIKISQIEIQRMETISRLDNPYGEPAKWVVNLRGSFRYIAAIISILCGVGVGYEALTAVGIDDAARATMMALAADLVGIPFAFTFGERIRLKS